MEGASDVTPHSCCCTLSGLVVVPGVGRRATQDREPDIAVESLKQSIPDKSTRILIYCNNNFRNAEGPFPKKLASASLNLSTYIALYNYGYRNVYELGPRVDLEHSKLPFESSPLKPLDGPTPGR